MEKITLYKMLPFSLQKDRKIKSICDALQPSLDKNWEDISSISIYKKIDTLDEDIVDFLAYSFHVDFYKKGLPLSKKRILVKNSLKYHRYKGTTWAVEDLISNIFSDSNVQEWYDYGGEPYFFKIFTKDNLKNQEQFNDFLEALYTVKNTRSWLECFVLVKSHVINIFSGGTYRRARKFIYFPFSVNGIKGQANIYQGMYGRQCKKQSYRPFFNEEFYINTMFFQTGTLKEHRKKYYGFKEGEL